MEERNQQGGPGNTPGRKKPPPVKPPMPMKGFAAWFLMMALVLIALQIFKGPEQDERIPYYPDFVRLVDEGAIRSCEIVRDGSGVDFIVGELHAPDEQGRTRFRVEVVVTEKLLTKLQESGTEFRVRPSSPFWQVFWNVAPIVIVFMLIYFFFFRQMKMAGGRAMSFGKSRAKLMSSDKKTGITFSDVAGVEEAQEELQEVVEFLKNPKQFQRLGGKMPKGVLLAGPPGTGKTLIAKAVAGEAEVPFFSISGSDFVEMFVGVGASRVRNMFEEGRKNAPCIIFVDEIDAVGRSRFTGIGGGHDEREQTLNAMLVEMDGFDTAEGIIIIAATNRPDVLDPALLRPGRFDRQVFIDLPNLKGREEILKIHVKRITMGKEVDLKKVARGTPGFSGADLMNLVNEAALLAARRGAESVALQDMEEARDKVSWGRERRSHMLDAEEKKLTAYHEAGHAVVLAKTEQTEPLHKVTVIPRGRALGATMQLPEKDRYTQGRKRLMGMLIGLMGGRAAEELVFGDVTTGAQNDIQRATQVARAMVCEFGMSDTLGPRNFASGQELMFLGREINRTQTHSERTAQQIDVEIDKILKEAHETAQQILRDNKDRLELIAQLLIKVETLDGEQVLQILETGDVPEDLMKNGTDAAEENGMGGKTWLALQNGSDVRGVAMEGIPDEPVTLTPEIVRPIGAAFAAWLSERTARPAGELRIAVGHDSRLSSQEIKTAVLQGLEHAGCTTLADCGLASTPAMFMATVFEETACDGSIMLTASHLPFNRNGLKFFTRSGGLEKADITEILTHAARIGRVDAPEPSVAEQVDLMTLYSASLVRTIREGAGAGERPLEGLRIVVDAGNGAGGFFVDQVLKPLGANPEGSQFLDPDGRFPNHVPNPEDPAAMDAIVEAVKRHQADLGIVFDTDVDRAAAVDRTGRPINRNRFIALLAAVVLDEHPGAIIVTDSVTSTGLKQWIEEKLHGVHRRFRRGYRNVINEAIRLNEEGRECPLAMETSGHGALKENYFLDDGAYLIAKVLIQLARMHAAGEGSIDELLAGLPEPAESAEYRIKIRGEAFSQTADRVLDAFTAFVEEEPGWSLTPDNHEGVHVTCDVQHGNGWLLLRKSLHDPVLPLNIESDEEGGVKRMAERIAEFLAQFDELDAPPMG